MKIGEIMIKLGYIQESQLEAVIREQNDSKKNAVYTETIGNIMLRKGMIAEEQLNTALIEYYRSLIDDEEQPSYIRETAKVAILAMKQNPVSNILSEEARIVLLKQIYEYEEKISDYEKSILILNNLEQKKVIIETINKEKKK